MITLAEMLNAAIAITNDAAKIAMSHFRSDLMIERKSDESPVTVADKATELAIRDGLMEHFPKASIFGEEYGLSGDARDVWIIDPIDGTKSFISGLPLFGMLLGYLSEGEAQLGVIRMPALGEVFTGAKGMGATCNEKSIKVSNCKTLDQARLFINEGDLIARDTPETFAALIKSGQQRRMSADCYPHALVAAGHADAVVDYNLQPYDFLPVSAVVQSAGGMMTDWQGKALDMNSDGRVITASTPELHAELLALVNG